MPGPVYHAGASGVCPHGGQITTAPGNPRVRVMQNPVATTADLSSVAACPFQIAVPGGTKPQPCVTVQWLAPAARVKAGAQPVLLQTSAGVCKSAEQIPQGPPTITVNQTRVIAT